MAQTTRKRKCKEAMIGFMLPYDLHYFLELSTGRFFLTEHTVFLHIQLISAVHFRKCINKVIAHVIAHCKAHLAVLAIMNATIKP
jgi:hypothetical protein